MAYYRYSTFERYPPRYVLPDELARNTTPIKLWLLAPLSLISVCLRTKRYLRMPFWPNVKYVCLFAIIYHRSCSPLSSLSPFDSFSYFYRSCLSLVPIHVDHAYYVQEAMTRMLDCWWTPYLKAVNISLSSHSSFSSYIMIVKFDTEAKSSLSNSWLVLNQNRLVIPSQIIHSSSWFPLKVYLFFHHTTPSLVNP